VQAVFSSDCWRKTRAETDQSNRKGNRETKDTELPDAASAHCDDECEFDLSATSQQVK